MIWKAVAEDQEKLSFALGGSSQADASPSSLQLTYEKPEVVVALEDYLRKLDVAPPATATGVIWVINGKPSQADAFCSPRLFQKMWRKLSRAAATEALAEHNRQGAQSPTREDLQTWWVGIENGTTENRDLPPRTRIRISSSRENLFCQTFDTGRDALVHMSISGN